MAPRILGVEDDRHFAAILSDYLGWIGCEVEHAPDADAAIRSLGTSVPDAILTDVLLPHMNGIEFARRVKGGEPSPAVAELPVVLMSAVYKDDAAIRASLCDCGADDYLVKPFAMGDLRGVLERLLPGSASQLTGTPAPSPADISVTTLHGEDLPRRGRVVSGFLARLLLRIRKERHTGVLRLEAAPRHKSIVFLNGHPVWALGSDEHDRLGTMLLEEKTISRAQFAQAIEAMRADQIDFGSALTSRRILAPSDLYRELRRLVARRVVSAFGWSDGEWTLGDVYPSDTPNFEVELLPVVLQGLDAHGDHKVLWAEVRERADQFVVPTSTFALDWPTLKAGEGIGALGPFLSGRRTLRKLELMEVLPEADFHRAIWLMYRAGMIGFARAAMDENDVAPITISMGLRRVQRSGGNKDLGERILADYFRLWGADHFRLFDLPRDAAQEEVDEALGGVVLSWTLDELASDLPHDVRDKAKALALRVADARAILGSPADRHAYREQLDRARAKQSAEGEAAVDEAAMFFDNGRGFLRTKDFREAAAEFVRAVERDPDSAKYLAYCGWAKYRSAQTEQAAEGAVAMLDQALEIDGRCPTAHFFRGVVHRDHRRYGPAAACFEAAVRYDPGFELARAALREAGELSGLVRRPNAE